MTTHIPQWDLRSSECVHPLWPSHIIVVAGRPPPQHPPPKLASSLLQFASARRSHRRIPKKARRVEQLPRVRRRPFFWRQ